MCVAAKPRTNWNGVGECDLAERRAERRRSAVRSRDRFCRRRTTPKAQLKRMKIIAESACIAAKHGYSGSMKTQIESAIARSQSYNEIVSLDAPSKQAVLDAIAELWDGETDYVMVEPDLMDVWGWTDETPENKQDWRLNVRIEAQ